MTASIRVILAVFVIASAAATDAAAAALDGAAAGTVVAAVQVVPAAADRPSSDGRVVRETQLDRDVTEVSSQLRCVVCQGLSIQDSPSTLAQEMRGVVREQLEAGRTPEEVKAYFVDRYGEWVLLRPMARGFNLIVYLLPIAMILAGAAFVFFKARTWTRAAPAGREGAPGRSV